MPSKYDSTHGRVLMSTSAIDISRIDSTPARWPSELPVVRSLGRATSHSTAIAMTAATMLIGPTRRTDCLAARLMATA